MKSLVFLLCVVGVLVGGWRMVQAEGASRSGMQAAVDVVPAPPVSVANLPGCDATVFADVRLLAAAKPDVQMHVGNLWNTFRARLAGESKGRELLAVLHALGLEEPSDILSPEICVPQAAALKGDADPLERAGVLVRGELKRDSLAPLLLKWAKRSDVTALWQHQGQQVIELRDELLVAQRSDGNVIVAAHPSALFALFEAPTDRKVPGAVLTMRAQNLDRLLPRDELPLSIHEVQSIELHVDAKLDQIHVSAVTSGPVASNRVAQMLMSLRNKLLPTRGIGPSSSFDDLVGNALARATIQYSDSAVTLDVSVGTELSIASSRLARESARWR